MHGMQSVEGSEEAPGWSRKRGSGASLCIECGEPAVYGRRCRACRNAREAELRLVRAARLAEKPCAREGCTEPRVRTASRTSSYCRRHGSEYAAEWRRSLEGAAKVETRQCAAIDCGRNFEWSTLKPNQRFCCKTCQTSVATSRARAESGRTWCTGHRAALDDANFPPSELKRAYPKCRECLREDRRRRNLDPEGVREKARVRMRERRFKEYGITPEQFDALIERQGGQCAICFRTDAPLVPDHCHTEGKFRGALCGLCNTALGGFRDDPQLLENAVVYLQTWHDMNELLVGQ